MWIIDSECFVSLPSGTENTKHCCRDNHVSEYCKLEWRILIDCSHLASVAIMHPDARAITCTGEQNAEWYTCSGIVLATSLPGWQLTTRTRAHTHKHTPKTLYLPIARGDDSGRTIPAWFVACTDTHPHTSPWTLYCRKHLFNSRYWPLTKERRGKKGEEKRKHGTR